MNLKSLDEDADRVDGVLPVFTLGQARGPARLETVVAVLQPVKLNGGAKAITGDFFAGAERVARPLANQGWCFQAFQVFQPSTPTFSPPIPHRGVRYHQKSVSGLMK